MLPWIRRRRAALLSALVAAVLMGGCGAGIATPTRAVVRVAAQRVPAVPRVPAAQGVPSQPQGVRAVPITDGGFGRIRPGTRIAQTGLSTRVFADATHGFALFTSAGGETFPAATADAGRGWRIAGPALHAPAAQGPLAVSRVAIDGPRTFIAFGDGSVVDITTDGGRHWWRAGLGDEVSAVVAAGGELIAFAQESIPTQQQQLRAVTWVYRSTDGGRLCRADDLLAPP
jgi:hypothetical protein